MERHIASNLYTERTSLKNISSSALVPENAKDLLHYAEKGQKRFENFVKERLLKESASSVWDSMKKLKLKAFSSLTGKIRVTVGQKVIKLREERELLGRFLIILGSRPELVPKLEDTIGNFEMSVALRSLFAVNH